MLLGLTPVVNLGESTICLGSNVAHLDTRERSVVFQGPNGDDKAVGTIVFAVNDETRLNEGMCASDTKSTDPKL